jgi:hypothetical protein
MRLPDGFDVVRPFWAPGEDGDAGGSVAETARLTGMIFFILIGAGWKHDKG